MTAILRKTWIEVSYWDCGKEGHQHKTETVALACMKKRAARKPQQPMLARRQRWLQAARAALGGATYKETGAQIGVSAGRAGQIVNKVRRMAMRGCDNVPEHDIYDIRELRQHKDFWLERIELLEQKWSSETQPGEPSANT